MTKLLQPYEQKIHEWLTGDYDEETKKALKNLLKENPKAAIDAFQSELVFGTGGLRAPVGLGTARFNLYTVSMLTQGLADFLKKKYPGVALSVIIGYDCRVNSFEFAEAAARVLIGNEISVHLFKELRPTPLVSFGCRKLQCRAGIMITASHNPPQDNGYKVYNAYGGQIAPPEDQALIEAMRAVTDLKQVKRAALDSPLLHLLGEEFDDAYLKFCEKITSSLNQLESSQLQVVYSNLHGTGGTLIPLLLKRCGFSSVTQVTTQAQPDGVFPTVKTANPENPEAMQQGLKCLQETEGDLLLATDPDADRVGVGIRESLTGKLILLTGSQVACLCLDFICTCLKKQNALPKNAMCLKTVVTSPLFSAIAKDYGVECFECLPGSKYISQCIEKYHEEKSFLFAAEDSCGYFFGDESREKDGVLASLLIAQAALSAKQQGTNLYQKLLSLYKRYGIYRECTYSLHFSADQEGERQRKQLMEKWRTHPPLKGTHREILSTEDFLQSHPPSNLLIFRLKGAFVAVRPSGTEPKIKFYVGCMQPFQEHQPLDSQLLQVDQELQKILKICKMA